MSKQFSAEELGEIREDWRRNANLRDEERMARVAQLHGCETADIAESLHLDERKAKETLTQGIRGKHVRGHIGPETRNAAVEDVLLGGMTQSAAAEKYGVSHVSVGKWVSAARKAQQEGPSFPDQLESTGADEAPSEAEPVKISSAKMETLATRANQICSAVEGAQCLFDEAERYSVLPQCDLDALADMIERMHHFQLGFEAGLAAAAAEAAQ